MATATTKRTRVAPAADTAADETAAEVVATPSSTPTPKRKRRMPVATFEIVGDELPANPKRKGGGGGGGGKSKWIKVFEKLAEASVPMGAWVKVADFPASAGATTAKRNMRGSIESGKLTLPEGVSWEVESRRVPVVDDDGEPTGVNSSALFIRKVEGEGHNLVGPDTDEDADDE